MEFEYSLRAALPQRVTAAAAIVYEYYNPENRAESKEAVLSVTEASSRRSGSPLAVHGSRF